MRIKDLRVCNIENPVGYDMDAPVFSWTVEDAEGSAALTSLVITDGTDTVLDCRQSADVDSRGFRADIKLKSRTRYRYSLTISTDEGETASADGFFETGKRDEAWSAKWISPENTSNAIIRKTFNADARSAQSEARLYVCGLGVYEAYINGVKAGDEYLAPGYHSYDFHLAAQTYDITGLLHEGDNTIEIWLGEGWFKGRLGFEGGYTDLYGDRLYAIAELYAGGDLMAVTDSSWDEYTSSVTFANIYDGETFDARIVPAAAGKVTEKAPDGCGPLQDRVSLPVRKQDKFAVRELIITPKGDTVLDFGQNMTGWVELDADLPEGTEISLTAGEIMQDDEFYNENYRTAKTTYTYISDGKGRTARPHFTFFGFRYMKVVCDVPVSADWFTAYHLRSDMPVVTTFTTGNELVNKLYQNALWGMKDNFLEVPTDCPQRDERLGWTGDAQAISETACQALYMPAFYRKYLWDMRAEQSILGGSVPNVVPRIKREMIGEHGSCPWADAGVIIPWNTWKYYGNNELLRETYPGMKAWVDFQRQREEAIEGPHLVKDGFHFADWLALDNPEPGPFGATDPLYISSAYYYRCAKIVAESAEILGLSEAPSYVKLADEILTAIRSKYFDNDGLCTLGTQTAAAIAIVFGLTENIAAQGKALRELVEKADCHLNTGFVGTPLLCPALSMSGNHDMAVTVLLQDDIPSWLYPVKMGATTIWERWNSVMPDGHINPEGMNSLNHYTFGSIGSWMISYLAGIRPAAPGYRRAIIEPMPDRRLGEARAEACTASGKYVSAWKYNDNKICYEIEIPFGAEAELRLPGQETKTLTAGHYTF
ncbi:MAG: family 78 glycoside hydrolase catalytic domain [Mogibacterium sp.]|nr:family 78 glycoside hydrolase catalytic domain [Mogibacterium sp.]